MFTRTLYLLWKYCLLNIKNKKRMNEAATTSSPNLNWNKYIPTSGLLKIITKKIKVSNPILIKGFLRYFITLNDIISYKN